jgi:hypothetical protein
MATSRRTLRSLAVVAGWCLLAIAGTLGGVGSRGSGLPTIRLLSIVVGIGGGALACLGAAVDAPPLFLDRRFVGFSPTQRRLLRYAGSGLAASLPLGAGVSLFAGGLVGVYLTLATIAFGLVPLGTALGRALLAAVRSPEEDADGAAEREMEADVDDRTRARRHHERR